MAIYWPTTNDWMRSKISFLVGPQEALLASVKTGKLAWFGHVTHHDSLSITILQGTKEDEQRRDRRGNAGWTTSKRRHPCPCQNCSHGSPAEKTGIAFLLNRPSCPPDHPFGHLVCELNGILEFWNFSRLKMLFKWQWKFTWNKFSWSKCSETQ